MKNLKGSLILLVTAFIWGTTFVAQVTGSGAVGTFTFNASRSYIACVFLGAVVFIRSRKEKNNIEKIQVAGDLRKRTIKGGALCGLALFMGMTFQQGGIAAYPDGVSASGRSGFITATYVVMVAVVSGIIKKKKKNENMAVQVVVSVVITIAGMYFLCISDSIKGIYLGDVLVLICAIAFTSHILIADEFSDCDCFKLSLIQFVIAGSFSLLLSILLENTTVYALQEGMFAILYAGVCSSGIAYTLQFVGQKYAEPTVASIVMSLESVFAALAGAVVLSERLTGREVLGCVLVFSAVILAQLPSKNKSK